jgi:DNA polymerase theta
METASAGFGVLIFCGSRKGCELTADLVSQATPAEADLDPATREARRELLNDLRSISVEIEPTLERTVIRGVAFHRECARL